MTPTQPAAASPIIHYGTANKPPIPQRPYTDPNLLSPDAAFYAHSPPRRQLQQNLIEDYAQEDGDTVDPAAPISLRGGERSRRRNKGTSRSASRKGKGVWKKLLWVKQKDYPDNYTDPPTFLSHWQRNPRFRPYDFWPLVADSTVIVQHISSVAIFICSFVAIYKQRVSPVSVVSWGTAATVMGWFLWDIWMGQEASPRNHHEHLNALANVANNDGYVNGSTLSLVSSPTSTPAPTPSTNGSSIGLGLNLSTTSLPPQSSRYRGHSHSHSQNSVSSGGASPTLSRYPSHADLSYHPGSPPNSYPIQHNRTHQRLATAKSAILIYTALLGLSPILKSLTESTSSDSIWALSTWLMLLHIFFFDYSGSSSTATATTSTNNSAKFPASLSTNAALMASTVLASRLPSTTHVFSLTLFSIEVFGLFPVWRRCLRHISWRGHLLLTLLLAIGAGSGLGLVISGRRVWSEGGWKRAVAGSVIWGVGSAVGMGGCSWWLIGLQRYKNVVIGPWDPARPVLRGGGWD